jgi:ubiquinone/menaquinone biosynthesis C-methylase UbiE
MHGNIAKPDLSPQDLSTLSSALSNALLGPQPSCSREQISEVIKPHLTHRLIECRNNVIPWIAEHMDIANARVLEIGAGTGSSAVALAEASAWVDAIDIMPTHLNVAQLRASLYSVTNVAFFEMNALDLGLLYANHRYDLVIFSATLEHMTIAERLSSLKEAWDHLARGGLLCIYESPNRLWYRDDHTGMLPFFHWLPDEIAVEYAKRGSRADFFSDPTKDRDVLARLGRGVSFHEFELAMGLDIQLVEKTQHEYLCERHEAYHTAWQRSSDKRYYDLLGELVPLPGAWREPVLNLLTRK